MYDQLGREQRWHEQGVCDDDCLWCEKEAKERKAKEKLEAKQAACSHKHPNGKTAFLEDYLGYVNCTLCGLDYFK